LSRVLRTNQKDRTRINTIITGEPALWLMEWKQKGLY